TYAEYHAKWLEGADALLAMAEEKKWSVRELREHMEGKKTDDAETWTDKQIYQRLRHAVRHVAKDRRAPQGDAHKPALLAGLTKITREVEEKGTIPWGEPGAAEKKEQAQEKKNAKKA